MELKIIDEFHVRVLVAVDLPRKECSRTNRTLNSKAFKASLKRAIRQVFDRDPKLAKVRLVVWS